MSNVQRHALPPSLGSPAARRLQRVCFRGAIGLVVCLGAIVIGVALARAIEQPDRFPWLFIAGGAALGYVRLQAYGNNVNLSLIPIMTAAYLYGPCGGALVALASAAGAEIRMRRLNWRPFFNGGVYALSGAAAGVASLPFATGHAEVPQLILFGIFAACALHATNMALLCAVLGLNDGVNPVKVWRERFAWMAPQTLLLGQVAAGIVPAYRAAGLYELIAFGLPIAGMQLAWRQYIAHTTRSVEDLRAKNADLIQLAARLQAANDQVLSTYRDTLEALVCALDARDNEVHGHSYRVSAYSQVLAERLGVERGTAEWDAIARGALLHDIGKIGVRDAVLRKPGKLDDAEWVEMRLHSQIGFGILHDVEFLRPAAEMVAAHHERYDGEGYPNGLKGDEIPLGARIFSVSDTFDAITTDRPYRRAAPPEAAVAEIVRCAGTQFDPDVVDMFQQIWRELWALREVATEMVA